MLASSIVTLTAHYKALRRVLEGGGGWEGVKLCHADMKAALCEVRPSAMRRSLWKCQRYAIIGMTLRPKTWSCEEYNSKYVKSQLCCISSDSTPFKTEVA